MNRHVRWLGFDGPKRKEASPADDRTRPQPLLHTVVETHGTEVSPEPRAFAKAPSRPRPLEMAGRGLQVALIGLGALLLAMIGLRTPSASARESENEPWTARDGWGWS